MRSLSPAFRMRKSILLTQSDLAMQVVEEVGTSAYGEMEIEWKKDVSNETGYAFVASGKGWGGGGGRNRGRGNDSGGSGRRHEREQQEDRNSARITTSTATSPSAGSGSSTSYLRCSSSRSPSTRSSRSSIPSVVGVVAGAARRSSITAPVTVGAGLACHSNSPTRQLHHQRGGGPGGGGGRGSHGALVGEVIWGAFPLPPLVRNLTPSSNSGDPLTDSRT